MAARNAAGPNSPNNANSTLNRPMASQGGTRYEDRTIQRGSGQNNAAGAAGGAAGGGMRGAGAYSRVCSLHFYFLPSDFLRCLD